MKPIRESSRCLSVTPSSSSSRWSSTPSRFSFLLSLLFSVVASGYGYQCPHPKVRKEWRQLSKPEKEDWICAVNVLLTNIDHLERSIDRLFSVSWCHTIRNCNPPFHPTSPRSHRFLTKVLSMMVRFAPNPYRSDPTYQGDRRYCVCPYGLEHARTSGLRVAWPSCPFDLADISTIPPLSSLGTDTMSSSSRTLSSNGAVTKGLNRTGTGP